MRGKFKEQFQSAFSAALSELTQRERNIMRLRFLDGLSVEHIAGLYKIHRVSASRSFSNARDKLLVATKANLGQQLSLDEPEVKSLMKLLDSQADISLARLMQSQELAA